MSALRDLLRGMLEEPAFPGDPEGGTVIEDLLQAAIDRAQGDTASLRTLLDLAEGRNLSEKSGGIASAGNLTIQAVGPDGQGITLGQPPPDASPREG